MLNSFIDLTEIYDLNSSFSIFNAIKKPEDRLKMLEIKLFNIFFKYLKNGACGIYFLLHQWNRHPSKPSSR